MKKTLPLEPPAPPALSHVTGEGEVAMVDVSQKNISVREAVASGKILLEARTLQLIETHQIVKGNVLSVARIAGIQAAKQTAHLIPLCHQLNLNCVEITFSELMDGLGITCAVKTIGRTGAEMEALTGVSVAALTIYDMCKAVDKKMTITDVRLVSKTKNDPSEIQ